MRIVKEKDIPVIKEEVTTPEGELYFSVSTYTPEPDHGVELAEGERVFVLDRTNSDWWLVRKNLTGETGYVPSKYLMEEHKYRVLVQKKLNEKIDKLPVFESKLGLSKSPSLCFDVYVLEPKAETKSQAPKFVKKLKPQRVQDAGTVHFECQVEGSPRPQVTWFRETTVIKQTQDYQIYYTEENVCILIIKEVFPEDAGTFTCVAKNSAGFASTTTELIVEGPVSDHGSDLSRISRKSLSRQSSFTDMLDGIAPTFERKPKSQCVNEGEDVVIECTLTAVPAPEIVWKLNGKIISSEDNVQIINQSENYTYSTTVKITKVKKSQEGQFEIIAINKEGHASIEVTLSVKTEEKEGPLVIEPLESKTVKADESVTLTTHIVGTPSPKVVWYKNKEEVTEPKPKKKGNHYSITFTKTTIEDTAEYTVEAKNSVGTVSTSATLTVEGK